MNMDKTEETKSVVTPTPIHRVKIEETEEKIHIPSMRVKAREEKMVK